MKWTYLASCLAGFACLTGTALGQVKVEVDGPLPVPSVRVETADPVDEAREAAPLPRNIDQPVDRASQPVRDATDDVRDTAREAAPLPRNIDRDERPRERDLRDDNRRDDPLRDDAGDRNNNANADIRWRYKFHNGEWWFWTKSNTWKIHRNGDWMDYDPATYQPLQQPVYSRGGGVYYNDDVYDSRPYYGGVYNRGFGYGYGYDPYDYRYDRGFYGRDGFYGRGGYYGGNGVYFGDRGGGVYIGRGGIDINTGRGWNGWGGAPRRGRW